MANHPIDHADPDPRQGPDANSFLSLNDAIGTLCPILFGSDEEPSLTRMERALLKRGEPGTRTSGLIKIISDSDLYGDPAAKTAWQAAKERKRRWTIQCEECLNWLAERLLLIEQPDGSDVVARSAFIAALTSLNQQEAAKTQPEGSKLRHDTVVGLAHPSDAVSPTALSASCAPAKPTKKGNPPGPPPKKRELVVKAMLEDYAGEPDRLQEVSWKNLRVDYGVSADTIGAALKLALSKLRLDSD